jgi:sec-independent protein translocase protein TatA
MSYALKIAIGVILASQLFVPVRSTSRAQVAGRLTRGASGATIAATRPRKARVETRMFGLGPMELVVILVIVIVLFGARRLPEIGSGFGKAIKNFKSGLSGADEIDVTPGDKKKVDPGRSDGTNPH